MHQDQATAVSLLFKEFGRECIRTKLLQCPYYSRTVTQKQTVLHCCNWMASTHLYSSGVNLSVDSSELLLSSLTAFLTREDSKAVETALEDRLLLCGVLCCSPESREPPLLPSSTSDFDVEIILTAARGVRFSWTRAVRLPLLGMPPPPLGERGREGRVATVEESPGSIIRA